MSNLPSAAVLDQVQFVAPDDGVQIDGRIASEDCLVDLSADRRIVRLDPTATSHHVRKMFFEEKLERG